MCHHGNPWLTELHEFDNDAAIVIERRHDTFEINLEVFGLELFILEGIDVLRVVGRWGYLFKKQVQYRSETFPTQIHVPARSLRT